MKKTISILAIIFVICAYFSFAQTLTSDSKKCVEVRRDGVAVKLCATCGNNKCEEGEDGCYSTSCTKDACTQDCGTALKCPSDCGTEPCPLIRCANPPDGCTYDPAKDENGCPTCGNLVCNDQCGSHSSNPKCTCPEGYHREETVEGMTASIPPSYIKSYKCVKNECVSDSDCPVINCIRAPCPGNSCVGGKCITEEECDRERCKDYICCNTKLGNCPLGFPAECRGCSTEICQPSCGNGKCEDGEADYCPPCTTDPVHPCKIKCTLGTCPRDCKEVKEQVKCVFQNSKNEEKCYSSKDNSCSGVETCVTDVSGYYGEQITWKSSCGGYAYTTMDGSNEYANFQCSGSSECGDGICSSEEYDCPECTTEPCIARACTNRCPKDCGGVCPTNDQLEEQIKKCKANGQDYETYEKEGCKFVKCIGTDKVECRKYKDNYGCIIISCADGYNFNSCNSCTTSPPVDSTGCTLTKTDDGCQITKCTDGRETKTCPATSSDSFKSESLTKPSSSSGDPGAIPGPSCGFWKRLVGACS